MDTTSDIVCSVCIANYNGGKILKKCIDSVLNQKNINISYEVIVHDDASTDNSVDLIKIKYPHVRLLESKENVGFCKSNNRMVSVAKGQFILLLNNDAELYPDALATLLAGSQSQSPQGIFTLPQYDWQTGELVDRGCLLDPFYNPVPNLDSARLDVAMVIGACLWIPRQLWIELGGFPEWMGSIAEDMYLCCYARFKGHPVQVAATSGYRHMQGKSFGGNRVLDKKLVSTLTRRQLSERNKTYILFLFTPKSILFFLVFIHFFLLLTEGVVVGLVNLNFLLFIKVYVGTVFSLFKNRNIVFYNRGFIQKNRLCPLVTFYKNFTLLPRKMMLFARYGFPSVTR